MDCRPARAGPSSECVPGTSRLKCFLHGQCRLTANGVCFILYARLRTILHSSVFFDCTSAHDIVLQQSRRSIAHDFFKQFQRP